MSLSRRNLATIVGVAAFAAALVLYLFLRPDAPQGVSGARASEVEAAQSGRSLRRRLATLLSTPPAAEPPVDKPTHAAGPVCDKCTSENCNPGTDDGCDTIADAGDRKLCEDLYSCMVDPRNNCVIDGDPVRCWCGTNMLTCWNTNSGPAQANGPCLKQIFAAAKSDDADVIFHQFLNPELPLGKATRLSVCRGAYCKSHCNVH
jgi:hypothetical protein